MLVSSMLSDGRSPITMEAVTFAGPEELEGELLYGDSTTIHGGILVANPHPFLGGTLNNNVVQKLSEGLAESQFVVLRFDYQKKASHSLEALSEDLSRFWETSHISDEKDYEDNLCQAFEYLAANLPESTPITIIGYSFGCSLLHRLAHHQQVQKLILVAPTIAIHDYESLITQPKPILVLCAFEDFACPLDQLGAWYEKLSVPKELITLQGDGHFFRGMESTLLQEIKRSILPALENDV